MTAIKHISFDMWNTLLIPNPDYAASRTRLISDTLNCSVEAVKVAYKEVKDWADNPATKLQLTPVDLMGILVRKLRPEWLDVSPTAKLLSTQLDVLFCGLPPIFAGPTMYAVRELAYRGITTSIASNTNFIGGATVRQAMPILMSNLNPIAWAFSDEVGYKKPHLEFFQASHRNIRQQIGHGDLKAAEILHVGDCKIADGQGAHVAGTQFLHIPNPLFVAELLEQTLAQHAA